MTKRKSALPKRDSVLKKRPKKTAPADAIEFRYAHGKETISTARRKSGK